MMFKSEYDQIIREYFDLSDAETRHYIATLESAGQDQLLAALSSALYDQIVSKVDDIDFGTIPLSRGDITKVQGWEKTEECISTIRNLVVQYKQDTAIIDVVINAITNIKDRKALFIKGYTLNMELPMLIYNLIVLSIERAVSLMIATCIQFVKDPDSTTMRKALDKVAYKNTMDDTMFKQLISFNNACKSGTIDQIIESSFKNPVKEDVEFQFDTVSPVDTENPTNDAGQDAPATTDFDPFDNSTAEPFGHEGQPDPEFSSDNDDNEEIPITLEPDPEEDFPEETHDDFGNPVSNDTVDHDHIDTVVPGDSVSNSDSAINEDELEESGKAYNTAGGISSAISQIIAAASKKDPKEVEKVVKIVLPIAGIALGAIVTMNLPRIINFLVGSLRTLVYNFYYSQMKFKEFLEIQADLIESNANEVEQSTEMDDEKKKKVAAKQRKIAERLRKWANKIMVDKKSAENKADKQAKEDERNKKKVHTDEDGEDVLF